MKETWALIQLHEMVKLHENKAQLQEDFMSTSFVSAKFDRSEGSAADPWRRIWNNGVGQKRWVWQAEARMAWPFPTDPERMLVHDNDLIGTDIVMVSVMGHPRDARRCPVAMRTIMADDPGGSCQRLVLTRYMSVIFERPSERGDEPPPPAIRDGAFEFRASVPAVEPTKPVEPASKPVEQPAPTVGLTNALVEILACELRCEAEKDPNYLFALGHACPPEAHLSIAQAVVQYLAAGKVDPVLIDEISGYFTTPQQLDMVMKGIGSRRGQAALAAILILARS